MSRRIAFTAVIAEDGFIIGIAEEGVPGYVRDGREPALPTWDEAFQRARVLNQERGLTDAEAYRIVGSSMVESLKIDKWKARG